MRFSVRLRRQARPSRVGPIVVVVIFYAVIFAPDHAEERIVAPAWVSTLDPTAARAAVAASATAVPFQYGDLFGYVSADGAVGPLLPVSYGVAASEIQYSPYRAVNYPITLYGRDGRLFSVIDQYGYPRIRGQRVIVLGQNGSTIFEWVDGRELWRRDFGTLISAVDIGPTALALSFFDGSGVVLDQAGATRDRFAATNGDSAVFSAVALSDDQRAAVAYDPLSDQLLLFRFALGDRPARRAEVGRIDRAPVRTIAARSPAGAADPVPYIEFLPQSEDFFYFAAGALYRYSAAESRLRLLHRDVELVDVDRNDAYIACIIRTLTHTALYIYAHDGTEILRVPIIDTSTVSDHFVRFSDPQALSLLVGIEQAIIAIRQQEAP